MNYMDFICSHYWEKSSHNLEHFPDCFLLMFTATVNQGPTGTWYPAANWHFFRYLTRVSSKNHRVAGNLKFGVIPNISGKPKISGKPWIPGSTQNTQEKIRHPDIPDRIFQHFYLTQIRLQLNLFSKPDPNPPYIIPVPVVKPTSFGNST